MSAFRRRLSLASLLILLLTGPCAAEPAQGPKYNISWDGEKSTAILNIPIRTASASTSRPRKSKSMSSPRISPRGSCAGCPERGLG